MLSLAHEIAKSGLAINAKETSVTARNIARVNDPDAARKDLLRASAPGGGVKANGIARAVDSALYDSLVTTTSASAAAQAQLAALERLSQTVGDPALELSPAAGVARLNAALQELSANPSNETLGQSAVRAAKSLAVSLNAASGTIFSVRSDADAEIAASVDRLNEQLREFERLNREVIQGTSAGLDITDAADRRDRLVRDMAELIGVNGFLRANNDMVLFAAGGITLFEEVPRSITFVPTAGIAAGSYGNPISVDGVPITVSGAPSVPGGKIGGLLTVRDDISVTYQRQLDEIARGLVEAFADVDQSPTPSQPDIAGLFTYAGGPLVPPPGALVDGVAASIAVAASVDPNQGGDVRLLRDGGIGDPGNPAYNANTAGAASFSERIIALIENLSAPRPFDSSSSLSSNVSIADFAASSAAWLEDDRRSKTDQADDSSITLQRVGDAWNNRVGINLDDQLATLIELEQAYQASARLISTVDQLFKELFRATE